MQKRYIALVPLLCLLLVSSLWALFNHIAVPKDNKTEILGSDLTIAKGLFLENTEREKLLSPLQRIPSLEDDKSKNLKKDIEQILEDLYSRGFTFNKIKNLYTTILQEKNEASLRELIMTFFENFSQASLTLDEYDSVQQMALDLIDNTKTRSMAISHDGQILDEHHMEAIYDNHNYDLSHSDKQILAQQYMNLRLLNGVNEASHSGMKTLYEASTSTKHHNRKVNHMVSMISSTDKDHARKIAKQNTTDNHNWDQNDGKIADYVPWVRSKAYTMPPQEAQKFLTNQFTVSDVDYKNEFFISGTDLLDQIPIQYVANYVESLNAAYLNAIYGQRPFREFDISGILNLFRSVMKKSQNNQLKLLIDNKIKTSIGTYPTYVGGILALKMIRDENIYIHENGFNIEDYLPEDEGNEGDDNGEIEELF